MIYSIAIYQRFAVGIIVWRSVYHRKQSPKIYIIELLLKKVLNNAIGLSSGQLLTHYLSVLVLIGFNGFLIYHLQGGNATGRGVYGLIVAVSTLTISMFFWQRHRLGFHSYTIPLSDAQFKEAVRRTAVYLEWTVEVSGTKSIRAFRESNITGSYGEMITIRRKKDQIQFNSICDPIYARHSVASYGWNERNRITFVRFAHQVLNEVPFSDAIRKVGKLWTRTRILKALLLYPSCFLIAIFGLHQLMQFSDIGTAFSGALMAVGAGIVLLLEYRGIKEFL